MVHGGPYLASTTFGTTALGRCRSAAGYAQLATRTSPPLICARTCVQVKICVQFSRREGSSSLSNPALSGRLGPVLVQPACIHSGPWDALSSMFRVFGV